MAETENRMDFSPDADVRVGSVSATSVPRYVLYGDSAPRPDWFVNVEPLEQRCEKDGWLIAPHTHPRFTQLVLVEHGGGETTMEGDTLHFRRGSVVVVPPYRIHGFRYAEATQGWVLTIENNYLAELLQRAPELKAVLQEPGVFDVGEAVLDPISANLEVLAAELAAGREGKAIAAEIQLLSILLNLLRHWPSDALAGLSLVSRADLVTRFKEIVERTYREQRPLTEVASELGVSVSQLRAACKSATGMSPLEIVHDRILSEARRSLAYTTMNVSEIGYWLGFSEAGYFSRFFQKSTGIAPSEYRRRQSFIPPLEGEAAG
jgi:AraC family transcriptional activator of pobA